jgi:hypothetical protein
LGGAAQGCGLFLLKTTGWERELSARSCGLFTEEDLLGALGGAARSGGRGQDRLVCDLTLEGFFHQLSVFSVFLQSSSRPWPLAAPPKALSR